MDQPLPSSQELRESWRGRALEATKGTRTFAVILSILADSYDLEMWPLLSAVFPGFRGVGPPSLVSSGRVAKSGRIIAMIAFSDGYVRWTPLYKSEIHLRDEFRKLADRLQLNDVDRQEMFGAIQRWLSSDLRLDPYMDPRDPDAKRLVH